MGIKNKYSEKWKFKIELRDDNKYKIKFIYNCLGIIQLCKDHCFGINVKTNKTNIVKYINKIFGANYCNNKIKRIIINYHKVIYKSRIYYKANNEINISINTIKFKNLKKIKKINK